MMAPAAPWSETDAGDSFRAQTVIDSRLSFKNQVPYPGRHHIWSENGTLQKNGSPDVQFQTNLFHMKASELFSAMRVRQLALALESLRPS